MNNKLKLYNLLNEKIENAKTKKELHEIIDELMSDEFLILGAGYTYKKLIDKIEKKYTEILHNV